MDDDVEWSDECGKLWVVVNVTLMELYNVHLNVVVDGLFIMSWTWETVKGGKAVEVGRGRVVPWGGSVGQVGAPRVSWVVGRG